MARQMSRREGDEDTDAEIRRLRADAAQAEQRISGAPTRHRTLRRRLRRWRYRRRRPW
jgi:hypothetical protein